MAKPGFVPPAGAFVLPGMGMNAGAGGGGNGPPVPGGGRGAPLNAKYHGGGGYTPQNSSSSSTLSEVPPQPPARNNRPGASASTSSPSIPSHPPPATPPPPVPSSTPTSSTSTSSIKLGAPPLGGVRVQPPPVGTMPGKQPLRNPKLAALAVPGNPSLANSRMNSRAFMSEMPPLFLQAVECGRKARIKELEFEYAEARQLYIEALEAFSTVEVPSLQTTIAQKREDYEEKVKRLDGKLAANHESTETTPVSAGEDGLAPPRPISPPPAPSSEVVPTPSATMDPLSDSDTAPVPESPFPAMNKTFHELFPELPPSEVLISYYSCSLSDGNTTGLGKVFLTNNLVCFGGSFDDKLKRTYKFKEVKRFEKKMLRIEMYTHTGEVVLFRGLVNARPCYDLMVQLLKSCNAVYGIPLKELLVKEGRLELGIPLAIEALVESLCLDDNLETEGLFRISAKLGEVEALANAIDNGNANLAPVDVHVKACVFKLFFRKLPEPLLTFDLYESFLAILDKPDLEQQVIAARATIAKLPPENRNLLLYLLKFLYTASLHHPFSKMTPENLAIVFGPLLLRSSEPDFDKVLKESMVVNDVITLLLQQYCQIAADELE